MSFTFAQRCEGVVGSHEILNSNRSASWRDDEDKDGDEDRTYNDDNDKGRRRSKAGNENRWRGQEAARWKEVHGRESTWKKYQAATETSIGCR